MNTYVWLIKREFWENRTIWIIPMVLGVLLVLGALFGTVEATFFESPEKVSSMAGLIFLAFGALFFAVMSVYVSWYLLECLYSDRKDRSILFWKALPISDTEMVLSKLLLALVCIPLVYFAAADAASVLAAFVLSVRAHSLLGNALWHPKIWLELQVMWLYVIATTAVWYLPFTGWLLLVSAFARRAVMLWSIFPLLAVMLVERLFIGTYYCFDIIWDRLIGFAAHAFIVDESQMNWGQRWNPSQPAGPRSLLQTLNPSGFLASPATWIGVLVGVALIAAAIQLRRRRAE